MLVDSAERECGCIVFREQVLPTASSGHTEARMDLIVLSPNVPGRVHIDLTVVSPLSVEALSKGSALRSGSAASLAAADKQARYDNCKVYPFPVEDHGRLGESARTVVRMIAPSEERSASITALYRSLSAVLQRGSAEAIIAAGSR